MARARRQALRLALTAVQDDPGWRNDAVVADQLLKLVPRTSPNAAPGAAFARGYLASRVVADHQTLKKRWKRFGRSVYRWTWYRKDAPCDVHRYRRNTHAKRVRFFTTVELVSQLEAEKAAGKPGQLANRLIYVHAIVLDELGYLPFTQTGGALLFYLLSKLYERTSVLV